MLFLHQRPLGVELDTGPGKNTGVGCHFLLQCMRVKSASEVAQSHCSWGALGFHTSKHLERFYGSALVRRKGGGFTPWGTESPYP